MIEYYRIPTKPTSTPSNQSLTITDQHDLKDSIYSKKIFEIKYLNMKNSNINDSAIGIFWTLSQPLQITHINLSQNFSFITDAALDSLCQATQMRELRVLNFGDDLVTNLGLRTLGMAANMGKLEELVLYGNSDISSEGLVYLGQSDYLKNLKRLDLHDTSICDKGLTYFLLTQNSSHLQSLNLSMNPKKVTDQTCKAISTSKYCKNLQELHLQDCSITDEGIMYLCESQNCEKLEVLDLNNSMNKKNNFVTDLALEYIAFSKFVKKLRVLQLRNSQVSSKGINTMSVSLGSENLEILRLSYCSAIRDDVKRYLESIIEYRSLKKLYINSTSVSKEIAESISQKYQNLNVIY